MGEIAPSQRPQKLHDVERRSQQKRPKRRDIRFWPIPIGYVALIAIGLLAVGAIGYLVSGGLAPSGSGVDNRESKLTSDTAPADAVPADTIPADTAPADAVPADTIPADTAPADAAPADAVPATAATIFELCTWSEQSDCVVEGDTIRYKGMRIRIEDIDAPGTSNYKCATEFGLGQQAKARLLELLNAGPFEVVQVGKRAVDPRGRQLRTLYRNGRSLGLQLVAEGLARQWEGKRSNWCP